MDRCESSRINLRVFLSYGHDAPEKCELIKDALEKRGYDVWFDKKDIDHGMVWRARIYNGITESDGIVSCLSKHSVRNPGVCLDELSIALSTDKGIKPILMESERVVRPPASITGVQWLDMSKWDEQEQKGTESFDAWFQGKMSELFKALEVDEYKRFSGEMSEITDRLDVQYDESTQKALLSKMFYGREWLADEIGSWLSDPESEQVCLLVSKPGIGKSAFAAHLAHYGCPLEYDALIAAAVFCRRGQHFYNSPANIIKTIAYLLARRLPEYRHALLNALDKSVLPSDNRSLFRCLLSAPLNDSIDGGHAPVCIVVDGLDECGDSGGANALAQALASFTTGRDNRLPRWIKLLVHTRDEENVLSEFGSKARKIRLIGSSDDNMTDIAHCLESELRAQYGNEPDFKESVRAIAERSQGVFLYATLMIDYLTSTERDSLSAYVSADTFPIGLDGAFTEWFGWFFPNISEYRSDFRSLLGVLAVAPSPPSEADLIQLFGWNENVAFERLSRIESLLEEGFGFFGDKGLRLSHKYIGEWLADRSLAGRFWSSPSDAKSLLTEACLRMAAEPARLSDYATVHLLELLAESGLNEDYDFVRNDARFHQRANELISSLRWSNRLSQATATAKAILPHLANSEGRQLSDLLYVVGELHGRRNDLPAAESFLRKAICSYEELADFESPDVKSATAMAKTELGCILRKSNRLEEAESALESALEMCRSLPEGLYLNELACACNNLGFFRGYVGNLDNGIDLYREALGYRRTLAEDDPETYLPDFARSCNNLGARLRKLGHLDESRTWLELAYKIRRKLAEDDPNRYLPALALTLGNLAQLSLCARDCAKAEKLNLEVIDIRSSLAEAEPFAYQPFLAKSHTVQADILIAQDREREALTQLKKALKLYENHPHLAKQQADVAAKIEELKQLLANSAE